MLFLSSKAEVNRRWVPVLLFFDECLLLRKLVMVAVYQFLREEIGSSVSQALTVSHCASTENLLEKIMLLEVSFNSSYLFVADGTCFGTIVFVDEDAIEVVHLAFVR